MVVLQKNSKGWKEVATFAKDAAVPAAAAKALKSSVLVLASDVYMGHLQLLLPNKKQELADDNIASILEDEYEIDTQAYEFASQKFTLSRDQVQMSISGIERETFAAIQSWITPFSPDTVWIMPFGWFVSALKSIEPVLLAVALSDSEILVSHHYLGVDDAREVTAEDLPAYVKARKAERKETHLMYLQASDELQESVTAQLDEVLAVHPLVEKKSDSILAAIAEAVWEKGTEALAELLHFEVSIDATASASAATEASAGDAPETTADSDDATETLEAQQDSSDEMPAESAAADLPKPSLPPLVPPVAEEVAVVASAEEDTAGADSRDSEDSIEFKEQSAPAEETKISEPTQDVPKIVVPPEPEEAPVSTGKDKEPVKDATPDITPDTTEKIPAASSVPAPAPAAVPVAAPAKKSAAAESTASTNAEETAKSSLKVEKPQEAAEAPEESSQESAPPQDKKFGHLTPAGVARASESRYVEVPRKTSWKLAFLVFLVVVVLTSIIGGAIFWSQQTVGEPQPLLPSTTPTPTPLIEAEEATESAEMPELATVLTEEEKSELSVLVLNALGVPGLAGDTEDQLTDAAWTDISVGNASGSYDDAVFVYVEDETIRDQVVATLEEDLDIEITVAPSVSESGSDDYDIVFIIADEVPWQ